MKKTISKESKGAIILIANWGLLHAQYTLSILISTAVTWSGNYDSLYTTGKESEGQAG